MKEHKFKYEWTLKDANFTKDKGKVFSCFACGGGSTMGYKLAGFDVIGCNEIDPKMIEAYKTNHNPKYSYLEPIQTFKLRKDLPKELYDLDILDGSPPCSSFSMAGNREKDWGKEKKFREGQANQVLDNLFFDFIDLAKELQPKVVVAENVSGLMMGAAKEYVKKIYLAFKEAGYQLRIEPYLLDASTMGVPQRRRRVFFIALRNDLANPFMEQVDMFQEAPKLDLKFNEKSIKYKELKTKDGTELKMSDLVKQYWELRKTSHKRMPDVLKDLGMKEQRFGDNYVLDDNTPMTLTSAGSYYREDEPTTISITDLKKIGSFPLDYDFINNSSNNTKYIIGMSVPPIMTAQISSRIYEQWLSKI
jgi:DNA (cytosine-5)-methyltransferase 1|tara:strand:+ start:2258 stop:3343 length:1086 start_codon:yes stop_codon:yes gene_type:complete